MIVIGLLHEYIVISAICALPADAGPCQDNQVRWHYEKESAQCVQFYYGGCDGNENNFASREECESSCPIEGMI